MSAILEPILSFLANLISTILLDLLKTPAQTIEVQNEKIGDYIAKPNDLDQFKWMLNRG